MQPSNENEHHYLSLSDAACKAFNGEQRAQVCSAIFQKIIESIAKLETTELVEDEEIDGWIEREKRKIEHIEIEKILLAL